VSLSALTPAAAGHGAFPGDSESARLMRTIDWAATPLGPVEDWSEALLTSVSITLLSRFPIVLFWGPELVLLYNDGYFPIPGDKHPASMGQRTEEVFSEIWPTIGPMFEGVMASGEATWSENQLLFLERHGFPEECYFTFSYSPVPDGKGGVAGIFCAVTETTAQMLRSRRLALLRDLQAEAATPDVAREQLLATLARHPADVPFSRFLPVGAKGPAWLDGISGPTEVRIAARGDDPSRAGSIASPVLEVSTLPVDPWGTPVERAIALPIHRPGGGARWGTLVVGLAPRLVYDDEYADLVRLVGDVLATIMTSAEARQMERERAEALAEADRAKTAFFTNISHEFRTPLTLLLGPLDELAATAQPEDRDRLDLARRNARRLYRLVNALLEFSRIEAGRAQATFEPVDLAPLTSQLASMFRSAFDSGGVRLAIDADPLPQPVFVDREMWERIVLNLVSNAFKHTYDGEVRVEIHADDDDAVLLVADTGVGIAADDLPRVFERFYRIDSPRARTHEGSGIGLALVQELVRLHGGSIEASSEVGRGTRFEVRIPFGKAHLPLDQVRSESSRGGDAAIARAFVEEALSWVAAAEPPTVEAEPPTERPRILVADDNADMRQYIRSVLEPEYEVELATDGEDALRRIADHRPGMVLADWMMPRLDGPQLVGKIRAEPSLRTLPVVLLSARAGEDAAIEGLSAGADDYLVKPFAAGDLRARISAHLATARLREQATLDLQEAEARFRTLVEHNPSGISLLDATGEVTYSNPTWQRYLGKTVDELQGGGWAGNIHPDDRDRLIETFGTGLATGQPFTFEYRCRRHDGAYRWFTTTLTPVADATGAVQSWIDVSVDTDDRKQAETALRVALDRLRQNETELRKALAAKDEFLSMVSHELRTPLTTILGNARVLAGRMRSLDADARGGALIDIADEAERLNQVIENLLVLARLEAGRTLDLEPILLGRFIDGVVTAERAANPDREYVTADCDPGLVVIANPDALTQVVANLLSNARKYSPPDQPIDVACERDGDDAAITVSDRGVGLDPSETESIFEPFYRSARTMSTSGMGIGLSVCRRLIEANGGTLSAAPRAGGGAVFTVGLPIAAEDPEDTAVFAA
jgi:PAS domain S-box-containing protein